MPPPGARVGRRRGAAEADLRASAMQRHNDAAIPLCFPAYDTAAVFHLSGTRATLMKFIFSAHSSTMEL